MPTPACPRCGSEMVERTNRRTGGRFYGCSGYPRCRGTRPIFREEVAPTSEARSFADFVPSSRQENVKKFLLEQSGHGVVMARPGSGKTTLLEWLMSVLPADLDIALLAFGKDIAEELKRRIRDRYVSTTHSLGFANIRDAFGRVFVKEYKVLDLIDDLLDDERDDETRDIVIANKRLIERLVGLCKATMRKPTTRSLNWITNRYNIDVNGDEDIVFAWTKIAFDTSLKNTRKIDYNDMIYFCAAGIVPCRQFDLVGVDETQDLNAAQLAMVMKSVKPDGRILAVGDRFQSIYGFRGADVHAVDNIIGALDAVTLPLDISYRLPRSHVEFINDMFPEEAHIEARPDAIEGSMESIDIARFMLLAKDGDLVICRRNAPLVQLAFALLSEGTKVVILGRDIGKGLIALIEKIERKYNVREAREFIIALQDWVHNEAMRLEDRGQSYKVTSLRDKVATIGAIMGTDCATTRQVKAKIKGIFSDDREGVTFSTIHKAKGQEAKRVFILNPGELGSHPKATRDWEKKQEVNIAYVGFSRSKDEMYFVSGA